MSYSRWSDSRWMAYHSAYSGESREDQKLGVHDADGEASGVDFTYKELTEDLEGCLKRVNGDEELKEIMLEFMNDVRNQYRGDDEPYRELVKPGPANKIQSSEKTGTLADLFKEAYAPSIEALLKQKNASQEDE